MDRGGGLMGGGRIERTGRLALALIGATAAGCLSVPTHLPTILPEQRDIAVRDSAKLPPAPLPRIPPPTTVATPLPADAPPRLLSLDEAIRTTLANSQVVRVLTDDDRVVSSGQTAYDPAIANTRVDQEAAAFDPLLGAAATYGRAEGALAAPVGILPGVRLAGTRTETAEASAGLSQRTRAGTTLGADVRHASTRGPGVAPFDPLTDSSAGVSLTQPLLRGAGADVNLAPVVIARINTERSFFQFKDATQELVRGTVEAYWAVVAARTDAWARRRQVEQAEAAFKRAEARQQRAFATAAEAAQARSSLATFRANLIAAEANLLQREAALRNILGLPPSDPLRLVLTTPPADTAINPGWDELLRLAEQRRPDIAELKLALEADQQRQIVAENQTLPQLDATAGYRWHGLEGTTPRGRVSTGKGDLNDWTVGAAFSLPVGLRQGRAFLRETELTIARDRANLQQGLHAAAHDLAESLRGLAQAHAQIRAYRETKVLSRESLEQQLADYPIGRAIFLSVLQAISEWGNAVSAEAFALAQYNTELATLERRAGTILDAHGVQFYEERYQSAGPFGRHGRRTEYPAATAPTPNADRYPGSVDDPEATLEKEKPRLPAGPGELPPPKAQPRPKGGESTPDPRPGPPE